MSHRGIAIDHPANAAVIARLAEPAVIDREGLVRRLEELQKNHPRLAIAPSIDRLRNRLPDPPRTASEAPDGVNLMSLGARPDILEHLWAIGRALPSDCRWVAFRRAVLAHPATGIIFGLAIGTLGYALRLPPATCEEAAAAGAKQTVRYRPQPYALAREFGPDWWFGRWRDDEDARWARAAYDYFGAM